MIIIGKRPEGYIVECTDGGRRHAFVVEKLGAAVTCPTCGHEEPSFDLASNFVYMRHALKHGNMAAEMLTDPVAPAEAANDAFLHRHIASGQN